MGYQCVAQTEAYRRDVDSCDHSATSGFTTMYLYLAFGLVIAARPAINGQSIPQPCESNIYCQGQLLHDIQLANIEQDSKTFVDMKLKYKEDVIIAKYTKLRQQYSGTPPVDVLKQFVKDNLESGNELEEYVPSDWSSDPSLARKVKDPQFKQWVLGLNNVTLTLSRRVKAEVFKHPELYSFLPVPNPFVIPGGRFLELYYWDSYWIVEGLLLCDMVNTARGVIENFFFLLKTYQIVPNGSRKYYLKRSQPPMLTHMVDLYYSFTKDLGFVARYLPLLEREYRYWLEGQSVNIKKNGVTYVMFRYYAPSQGPRPESYREDYNTASTLATDAEKTRLYINLKSAAESGNDFSTRWFIKDGTNQGNLSDVKTEYILPVDLNSHLHFNLVKLGCYYQLLGNKQKADYYKARADFLLKGIEEILFNPALGVWLDFDLLNKKPRDYFYLTNFTPLWTRSYRFSKERLTKSVLSYLAKYNIPKYDGAPTSVYNSGQQWDFPNGWAPLQSFLIEGLRNLGTKEALCAARYYALKWISTNYKGWTKYKKMFEKYDVELPGETGSGGEYAAQTGFGWSNGFICDLLNWLCDVTVDQMNAEIASYKCRY